MNHLGTINVVVVLFYLPDTNKQGTVHCQAFVYVRCRVLWVPAAVRLKACHPLKSFNLVAISARPLHLLCWSFVGHMSNLFLHPLLV